MPFVVTCPQCKARYSAPDQLRGQRVQCPSCQASIVAGSEPTSRTAQTTAPRATTAGSTATASASNRTAAKVSHPPTTFVTSCTHCRQQFAAPANLQGQLARCPGCGQSFKAMPTAAQQRSSSAQTTMTPPQDWKWFEENFEPYKPPEIKKDEHRKPQITLPQILNDDRQAPLRLASRSSRLIAAIVDSMIGVGIPMFLYIVSIAGLVQEARAGVELSEQQRSDLLVGVGILGGAMVVIGLINLILLAVRGQTIGKALIGIKIVGSDGYPCFARILFIRMIGMGILNIIPGVGLVDVLLIFRENRQCLHDQLADTMVVQAR